MIKFQMYGGHKMFMHTTKDVQIGHHILIGFQQVNIGIELNIILIVAKQNTLALQTI